MIDATVKYDGNWYVVFATRKRGSAPMRVELPVDNREHAKAVVAAWNAPRRLAQAEGKD